VRTGLPIPFGSWVYFASDGLGHYRLRKAVGYALLCACSCIKLLTIFDSPLAHRNHAHTFHVLFCCFFHTVSDEVVFSEVVRVSANVQTQSWTNTAFVPLHIEQDLLYLIYSSGNTCICYLCCARFWRALKA
jgi:hypothetical protein